MRVKKLRKLTLGESMSLLLLAGRIEEQVDGTLADLVRRAVVALGLAAPGMKPTGAPDPTPQPVSVEPVSVEPDKPKKKRLSEADFHTPPRHRDRQPPPPPAAGEPPVL